MITPEQFKAIRTKIGVTQPVMARLLGVKLRAIVYYEKGGRGISRTVELLLKRLVSDYERGALPLTKEGELCDEP